jgi:SAM-dependent methyltransferase
VIEASLDRVVAGAVPYRLTGRWLDIGFGEGGLLSRAEKRGWACYGIEPSPQALQFGASRGWIVSSEPSSDPRFREGAFDVVSMVEVLEHLRDPRGALREAARWLRPDGLLYMTTPNARSLNSRLLGPDWSVFCPPEHLNIFTRRGLRRLVREGGLSPLRVRTEGFNPVELLARMRPRDRRVEPNRQAAALALNQALSASAPLRAAKGMANAVLNVIGSGDGLKVWATKPGTRGMP